MTVRAVSSAQYRKKPAASNEAAGKCVMWRYDSKRILGYVSVLVTSKANVDVASFGREEKKL